MPDRVSESDVPSAARWMTWSLVVVTFLIVLLRTAWIADAAYLTLRTVEHAAAGYGLRWNVVERVGVYDDPLWTLVLLGARRVSHESYFTAIGMGLCCSMGMLILVLRHAMRVDIALALGLSILLSPLFVTFSTSGLEAPLLHVLLALLCIGSLRSEHARRGSLAPAAVGALAVLARAPAIWLVAPIVITTLVAQSRARRIAGGILLVGPWSAWLAVSWWYYGTIWTASSWADASSGIMWQERVALGWQFLTETLRADPVLTTLVIGGWVAGWFAGRIGRAATIGGLLLTAWLVARGGSPMAGRDLTMLGVPALLMIARVLADARPIAARLALVVPIVAAAATPTLTLASGASFGDRMRQTARAHDARADDYHASGLLFATREHPMPLAAETTRARALAPADTRVIVSEHPGFFGAGARSDLYVLDVNGTLDPLLPRIPEAVGARWLWGAPRRIPDGYADSLPDGPNRIAEPSLAMLYDDIRRLTRGPLSLNTRASAISRLSQSTPAAVAQSSYGTLQLPLSRVTGAQAAVPIGEGGLLVTFDQPRVVHRLTVDLSRTYDYGIDLLGHSVMVGRLTSGRTTWQTQGAEQRQIPIATREMVTAVAFHCQRGLGPCTLEHLAVD